MSNNIYNILNNFNKVAQEVSKPATPITKPKSKLQESVEGVLSEKYMGFKKTATAIKKGGSAENPEAVAASIGRKKYGKEKFQKAAAAGKKLGEERTDSPTIKGTDKKAKSVYVPPAKPPVGKLAKPIDEANDGNLANNAKPYDKVTRGDVVAGRLGKDEMGGKKKKVKEVAPPGAKAERMVKHIKKGYAKDGKITPKEKSIAYATAWKAHNKGKVEEAIKAMFEAGYTKEQIVEGWEEMLKSVEKNRRDEKGTGKFDKKKDQTTGGTVYTRKYNAKTGETDDTENVSKEKRGRGRPKKSTFEGKYTTVNKMVTESFLSEQGSTAPVAPADREKFMKSSDPKIFDKLTGNKDTGPKLGTIKGGVWTADAPKPGEKGVPVPQDPEVAKEDSELEEMKRLAGLGEEEPAGIKASPFNNTAGGAATGNPNMARQAMSGFKAAPAMEEDDMEEGNEFSGALAKAKAAGAKEFQVGGKTYQVNECGMSPMGNGMMGQESAGKMNVSTNMSSDGNKSVTITADGDAALELMQMLKLAGMQGSEAPQQQEPQGVMVVSTDDEEEVDENLVAKDTQTGQQYTLDGGPKTPVDPNATPMPESDEEVDEAKDERYHASTTPDEHVEPVQSQTKGGNGDVAGQEKRMRKGGYQFGDNNLAMSEVSEGIAGLEAMGRKLYKEYESIKVQK